MLFKYVLLGLIVEVASLLNNYKTFAANGSIALEPYQAIVVKVK
jgi:hypothetical protein